ncbi:MAG TPA: GDSL-type esterase/lipase family protein, partial [Gemmataceae bacterium]|nr:GDSL-type esterase/lipase family protein [Gemmataceae bacterium]
MKSRHLLISLAFVTFALLAFDSFAPAGQDKKADQDTKAEQPKKKNTAIIPTPFQPKRHEGFLDIAKKGDIDILLMGDSITDGWRNTGKAVYAKHFEPLKTANFGIGGDTTQGVLWRMDNGELDGYSPKLMMLMIGTNNIGRNTPEEIAEGINAVVGRFRKKHDKAKVLLLAVFPRTVKGKGLQPKVKEINDIIAKSHDGKSIFYLDIGEKFLDKTGTIPLDVMKDGLHPTAKGYEIWAEAVMPKVYELIGRKADQDKKSDQPKKDAQEKKKNTAIIPTEGGLAKRHQGFMAIAKKGDIDILLMGDSITDGWRNTGKAVFAKHFEPLKTANFGISGDVTQGVLWRMDNGELDG